MTRILGEYTTMSGEPRRLVAVQRTGPSGWCLLDVPACADAPADDFQIVRRLGSPSTFDACVKVWIAHATCSPLGERWLEQRLVSASQRGALAIRSTVDIYNDSHGLRQLAVVQDPALPACWHLVDLPVDAGRERAGVVAVDVRDVDFARDIALVHVERELVRCAARTKRCV